MMNSMRYIYSFWLNELAWTVIGKTKYMLKNGFTVLFILLVTACYREFNQVQQFIKLMIVCQFIKFLDLDYHMNEQMT